MKTTAVVALSSTALIWLLVASKVDGFSVNHVRLAAVRSFPHSVTVAAMKDPSDSDGDIPKEEQDEYTGSIDWDAEWKKVMQKEKSGEKIERPGKDFYKTDAELAAIRAANKAQNEMQKMSSKLPSPPSMNIRSFSGDWRVRGLCCVPLNRILLFVLLTTEHPCLYSALLVLDWNFSLDQCRFSCFIRAT